MCGIFGSLSSHRIPIDRNILSHRGPDDWGVKYNDFPAGILTLFQSRLSIIGLGKQGHQPFCKDVNYLLIYNGEIYIGLTISKQVIEKNIKNMASKKEASSQNYLTRRETEILQLVANGLNNKEIAERLHISKRTVETHRVNIKKKLRLNKSSDFMRYAIQSQLLDVMPSKE